MRKMSKAEHQFITEHSDMSDKELKSLMSDVSIKEIRKVLEETNKPTKKSRVNQLFSRDKNKRATIMTHAASEASDDVKTKPRQRTDCIYIINPNA